MLSEHSIADYMKSGALVLSKFPLHLHREYLKFQYAVRATEYGYT